MVNCRKCGFYNDCDCYGELVDKIHEKISEHKKLHFNNYIIEQLESLLDDEK